MDVINPLITKNDFGKKIKVEKITTSTTWTIPSGVTHVWTMVFGAGGNPHTSYNGGAGGGHLKCADFATKAGEKITVTIGEKTSTNGAGGQASSIKYGNITVTALGGSGVTSDQGSLGGTGGGGGYTTSTVSCGGTGTYGGGGEAVSPM